jgi:hypothetical protein
MITLTDEASGQLHTFDDAGPPLSPSARSGLLNQP